MTKFDRAVRAFFEGIAYLAIFMIPATMIIVAYNVSDWLCGYMQ